MRTKAAQTDKGLQVTNYVLRLPDAYIVYEPAKDVFQIAALGVVSAIAKEINPFDSPV